MLTFWLDIVLIAGIVAAVLNLILPQEDAKVEDDTFVGDADVEVVDVEAHHDLPEVKK